MLLLFVDLKRNLVVKDRITSKMEVQDHWGFVNIDIFFSMKFLFFLLDFILLYFFAYSLAEVFLEFWLLDSHLFDDFFFVL